MRLARAVLQRAASPRLLWRGAPGPASGAAAPDPSQSGLLTDGRNVLQGHNSHRISARPACQV